MRTYEIEDKEAELQAELARLAQAKKEQAEREKAERLDLIAGCEEQAQIYREQAAKALTDDDKKRLYRYASDSEAQANEYRKELGIEVPEAIPNDETDEQDKARLSVVDLFRKALFFYATYLAGDYFSSVIEPGFFSFGIKSVASLLYAVTVVLGGSWLSYSIVAPFLSGYILGDLRNDFNQTTPGVRLAIVAGLFFSLLFVLSTLAYHVN